MFTSKFIKASNIFNSEYTGKESAPVFFRKFNLKKTTKAFLSVCGLGYGYYYINGDKVTDDLFTAPVSAYDKYVWYNRYDVTGLLKEDENTIAVILGNGFFNESFPSNWKNNGAKWRDCPKFALSLTVDGEKVLESDETFLCSETSFVTFNQLRSGETFDARIYNPAWKTEAGKCVSHAVADETMNGVERLLFTAPPVAECEEYDFTDCVKTDKGYTLDFGLNTSGYLRVFLNERVGTEITFRHAEEINADGSLKLNGLNVLYPTVDFQTDRYICGKTNYVWSPKFTYHGFRYVSVEGLTKPPVKGEIKAVFVRQKVEKTSEFSCSDEILNKIYEAGIRATQSNMFYALTDCPTREKFGWTNDAQASAEQIYINFDCKSFFEKWIEDFKRSMTDSGALPAIVPTHGYGYYHGPVADGAFFEIPYIHYLYTGDESLLVKCLPYYKRYYKFYFSKENADNIWLCDWDGYSNHNIDKKFIRNFYAVKICRIIIAAKNLACEKNCRVYENRIETALAQLRTFIDENGGSKIEGQTAAAALLHLGLGDRKKLVSQIKRSIDCENGHLNCGMFGIQYIYEALSENGEAEYAYKIITAKSEPSIAAWIEKGGTTLWETWKDSGFTDSRNHHMYSNVLAWLFKYLLGIRVSPGYKSVDFQPCFVKELNFCKGSVKTLFGRLEAEWKRHGGATEYSIVIPKGIKATFRGKPLRSGKNIFVIHGE